MNQFSVPTKKSFHQLSATGGTARTDHRSNAVPISYLLTKQLSRATMGNDAESGLDNFGARYNASSMGRFMSADPANTAGDLDESGNPRSWNAYSYVQNDPINATDPDGLDCVYISGDKAFYNTGNCIAGMNGTYVNGRIDPKSGAYDPDTGTVTFNYTNSDTGTIGKGVVGNVYPSPGVSDTDRLNAVAQGTQLAEKNIKVAAIFMAENAALEVGGGLLRAGVEAALAARAARAAKAAAAAVDVNNLSNKIVRQMLSRGWTMQEILDTVQNGKPFDVINKATGGPATEYVSSSGKFVVIDNATKQVLQVSGPGFLPNHL
jgi:RHS repeat-associated protein